jgi:TPR repeat protein
MKILSFLLVVVMSVSICTADINSAVELLKGKKYDEAYKELLPIAEKGDSVAQFNLSLMFYNGNGVPKDYKKSFDWCEKSANGGLDVAQERLGMKYLNGYGVQKDPVKAQTYLTKATEQGNTPAMMFLGTSLVHGKGLQQNTGLGLAYLEKAAKLKDVDSQYCLGNILLFGHEGVKPDYEKATFWLGLAARAGDKDAQRDLGFAYVEGKGVNIDYSKAYAFLSLASTQGDERARGLLENVVLKMAKAEEIEAGKALMPILVDPH